MNLYIELEIYNREIQSKVLLALEAVKKGYNVIIAHRSIIQKLALEDKLPPGIIHMKDANSTKEQIDVYKKLKKKQFYLTAQDEESGLLNDTYKNFAKIRFGNFKSFNYLSFFFCWGERDFQYLKKKIKIALKTGSPRFDLFHKLKRKKGKRKKILIISSFNVTGVRSFADRIFATTHPGSSMKERYKIAEKFAYNMESIHALKVYHFVNLTRFLSRTFKNYDIYVRPHPNDNIDDWKKLINDNTKNIKIDRTKDISLDQSILSSNFVIQNGCTSAIESLLLNVPCISYIPQEWKEDELAKFPNSLGTKATSHLEVKKIIQSNYVKKTKIRYQILKKRLLLEKNYYSNEKQVEFFDKLKQKSKKFKPNIIFKTKYFIIKILKNIKDIIFKRKISPIEKKFPRFNDKKIKKTIHEISIITNKDEYLKTKFNIIGERFLFLTK
jgi:surface carbohydrate biosynthesis protein